MSTSKTNDRSGNGIQFVTFCLGQENYAIPVNKVREIIRPIEAFPVPGMEGPVEGVINLRGEIIPVVKVHGMLSVKEAEGTDVRKRRIIILDAEKGGVGIVVDEVMEVVKIVQEDIQKAPEIYSEESKRAAVIGIVQMAGKMIVCVEPAKLLAGEINIKEMVNA